MPIVLHVFDYSSSNMVMTNSGIIIMRYAIRISIIILCSMQCIHVHVHTWSCGVLVYNVVYL